MNKNTLRQCRIHVSPLLVVSFVFFLLGLTLPAAEPLSETLQKGLFEQEANRNLPAAIEHYEAIIKTADEQRKIVATALYHLAECYRKMGKEEQANALYTRLRRDFSEHKDLIQRLAGRSPIADESLPHSHLIDEPIEIFQNLVGAQRDVEFYRTLLQQLQQQARATLPFVLATAYPDEALGRLIYQLHQVEQDLASKSRDIGGDHPGMKEASALRDKLREQINERLDGVLVGLESLQAVRKQVRDEMSQSLKEKSFEPVLQAEIMSGEMRILKRHLRQAQQDQVHYEALIKEIGQSDRAQLPKRLPALLPDSHLDRLIIERNSAEQQLQSLLLQYTERHPQVVRVKQILRIIQEQIDRKIDGMLAGIRVLAKSREATYAALSERYRELETKYQQLAKTLPSSTLTEKPEASDRFESLERLLKNSPDLLNAPTKGNRTYLQNAAAAGDVEMLQFLLQRGALVDKPASDGSTPLHFAAEQGHKRIAELLLEADAHINARSQKGTTPLHIAAANGYLDLSEFLLSKGADIEAADAEGKAALHHAVEKGHLEEIALLLKHGANIEAQPQKTTPLLTAIYRRQLPAALALLDAGADPNKSGYEPPLHHAIQMRNLITSDLINSDMMPLFRALLAKGADPNLANEKGQTALHLAIANGDPARVDLLLQHGANIDQSTASGKTPLHYAVGLRDHENDRPGRPIPTAPMERVLRLLLEKGAKPNSQDNSGLTPLHYARYSLPLARLLLQHKADPNLKTKHGLTVLDLPSGPDDSPARQLIIEHGGTNAFTFKAEKPIQ